MIWRFFKLPQTISRIIKRILIFNLFLNVKCGKGDTSPPGMRNQGKFEVLHLL